MNIVVNKYLQFNCNVTLPVFYLSCANTLLHVDHAHFKHGSLGDMQTLAAFIWLK